MFTLTFWQHVLATPHLFVESDTLRPSSLTMLVTTAQPTRSLLERYRRGVPRRPAPHYDLQPVTAVPQDQPPPSTRHTFLHQSITPGSQVSYVLAEAAAWSPDTPAAGLFTIPQEDNAMPWTFALLEIAILQTIPSGIHTPISWPIIQTQGGISPDPLSPSDTFIVNEAGVYLFMLNVLWQHNPAGTRHLEVNLGGFLAAMSTATPPPLATAHGQVAAWPLIIAAPPQSYQFAAFQDSGGPLDIIAPPQATITGLIYKLPGTPFA